MNIDVTFEQTKMEFHPSFNTSIKVGDSVIFIPNVSEDGIISWTNNNNMPNPEPINIKGKDGIDGKDGTNGTDGISITKTEINTEGKLVVAYSNGTTDTLGVVVGAAGKDGINGTNGVDGVGISKMEINAAGELCITYSNGSFANLGNVVGADGKDGANGVNGADGKDGISVTKTEINAEGKLVISYSNGEIETLGKVVGTDGKDGVNGTDGKDGINGTNGADGKDGADGEDGVGITKAEIVNGELILYFSNNTNINLGNIKGADGKDGVNGTDGKDGVSPTIDVISISGGHKVTVTDINGVKEFNVMDGKDGKDGGGGISEEYLNEVLEDYTTEQRVWEIVDNSTSDFVIRDLNDFNEAFYDNFEYAITYPSEEGGHIDIIAQNVLKYLPTYKGGIRE